MKKPVYLDYNATGVVRPEVADALTAYFSECGNPSSVHQFGRNARAMVDHAREQVAVLVNVKPAWVVFTSGGTEANNQAIRNLGAKTVLISSIEHDSTIGAAYASGANIHEIPVTNEGVVDLVALEKLLAGASKPVLVSVMLANNETGVIQPVKDIAALAHKYEAFMHTDAIQAAGKLPVDFADLDVDLMSLSAHKMNGLSGVGALVFKPTVRIGPLIMGGGQEFGWRSGTENVPGIVAFGCVAEIAQRELKKDNKIKELRDYFETQITTFCKAAKVVGKPVERLQNTSCISMPGVSSETQVMALDLDGFCISAGSACSSGKVRTSHVLSAMGFESEISDTAIRVSLGWQTTKEDVEAFSDAWKGLYSRTHELQKAGE